MPRVSRKKAISRVPENPVELAQFVAERTAELALLTGQARWPLLTYFLNMARIEAETRVARDDIHRPERRVPADQHES